MEPTLGSAAESTSKVDIEKLKQQCINAIKIKSIRTAEIGKIYYW